MPDRYLSIYVRDHLAGAAAGLALARRAAANHEGTPLGEAFSDLAREIAADRSALESIAGELGIRRSRAKELLATGAERAGRLKLNGRIVRQSPLSAMVELDALSAGIEGKAALWRSLAAAGVRPTRYQLDDLQHRAEAQHKALERHRGEVARAVLG